VPATFVRNGTLSCTIPGTVLDAAWAAASGGASAAAAGLAPSVGVEISLNGGQQYTASGATLALRAPELISSASGTVPVEPNFSYVEGGALLKVSYSQAFAPSSPRAACLFRWQPAAPAPMVEVRTPITGADVSAAEFECRSPPARLLGSDLGDSGGQATLLVSTNGRDASANSWPFLYRLPPRVDSIVPDWLVAEQASSPALHGV
jgi:hypothetical protein